MTAAAWVQAGATLVLVGLTWWYARSASNTLSEAKNTAEATTEAAKASAKAAESAERQVALMERQQARREIEMMPMIWARRTGFDQNTSTASVQLGNASGSAALEVTLRIYHGRLPGPPLVVTQPVTGDPHPQEEKLQYPATGATRDDDYKIEARYRDRYGNRWAVQCPNTSGPNYFRIEGGEDGGTPRFVPIAPPVPLLPPQG